MNASIALSSAISEFRTRLQLVGEPYWSRPTPCDEWDVRALVNHVVGGNTRYAMLLHGATAADVDETRSADHLRGDALAAFVATASDMQRAFAEPGALERIGHHPAGDRRGAELLDMRVLDLAIHAWDLARAIGADDTLSPDLVEFLLAAPIDLETGRRRGTFAPPVAESTDANPQARLLALVGRDKSTKETHDERDG
jgi:uncharacterized protein (TIGR03086 family)